MRVKAKRDPSIGLIPVLAATLVAASLLGLAASQLFLFASGGSEPDVPSSAVERQDIAPEQTGAPVALLGGNSQLDALGIGTFPSEDVTTTYQPLPLHEAAGEVLTEYEARGNCLLCEAGYLDLQGNVWACVVQGDGWVEVQVVRSVDEGQGSELTLAHMDAGGWAQELDGLVEEGS